MEKQKRGLGIRDIRLTNQCMLFKWWWRYAIEDDALWKAIVCCKYGSAGGKWLLSTNITGITSKIWRDIVEVSQSNPKLYTLFLENMEIIIGNGKRIMFWIDNWIGDSSICNKFLRLYQLCTVKEASLNEQISRKDSSNR